MRYVAVTFILTCVIAQYLMIMQYKVTLPYNHPQFSLEAFSRWTQIIFDHPILLLRSTNFFRLMGFEQVTWNFIDGIYLIIFPLAQLGCLAGVLYLFSGSIKSKRIFDIMLRPKNIVRAGILTSIVLISIVVITAPDKSAEEIKRRVTYNNLLSTGDSLLAEKNFDAAKISFKQASALIPNLWIPYFKQGIVFGSQNKFEQAEEQYRIALDIYPDHPALLSNYGATLAILGRTEEAEPVLRNAIRQRPNNANAYNALAQVFIKQKKYQKAGDMLLLAVAVNPNFGTGHANLAMLYAMMNQREKAKSYLGKALQLGVNNLTTTNLQNFLHSPLKAP
ncbi:tetratricopeptide repeat protein [bacterium]|nr:tetratricopeptide repeat protein [bacterium]